MTVSTPTGLAAVSTSPIGLGVLTEIVVSTPTGLAATCTSPIGLGVLVSFSVLERSEVTCKPLAEAMCKPSAEATCEPLVEATCNPSAEATCEPLAEATCKPLTEATCEPDVVDSLPMGLAAGDPTSPTGLDGLLGSSTDLAGNVAANSSPTGLAAAHISPIGLDVRTVGCLSTHFAFRLLGAEPPSVGLSGAGSEPRSCVGGDGEAGANGDELLSCLPLSCEPLSGEPSSCAPPC